MMTLYIMNSTIAVPENLPALVTLKKISIDEAVELIDTFSLGPENQVRCVSAIGHAATAAVLSQILKREIPWNRVQVSCKRGDICLCFKLRVRLEEGKILSEEELKKIEYDLIQMNY